MTLPVVPYPMEGKKARRSGREPERKLDSVFKVEHAPSPRRGCSASLLLHVIDIFVRDVEVQDGFFIWRFQILEHIDVSSSGLVLEKKIINLSHARKYDFRETGRAHRNTKRARDLRRVA